MTLSGFGLDQFANEFIAANFSGDSDSNSGSRANSSANFKSNSRSESRSNFRADSMDGSDERKNLHCFYDDDGAKSCSKHCGGRGLGCYDYYFERNGDHHYSMYIVRGFIEGSSIDYLGWAVAHYYYWGNATGIDHRSSDSMSEIIGATGATVIAHY